MLRGGILSFKPLGGSKLGITNCLQMSNEKKIPQLAFGTYQLSSTEVEDAVKLALSCGYRHIDCAKAYGNQRAVGEAIRDASKARHIRRDDLFVTSKLWPTDQHPDHVEAACRETLAELGLDYLDLYLIHWPICWRHSPDFKTPEDKYPKRADGRAAVEESVTLLDTWQAMNQLVEKGLVRSIGLSNCTAAQVDAVAGSAAPHAPVLNQVELHPGCVDRALLTCHGAHGILTGAYCPLGMPTRYCAPGFEPLVQDKTLQALAEYTGFSVPRLLLNWSLDMNNVVVVRSKSKAHIESNAKAARFALESSTRWVLDNYRRHIRQFRVMNPTDFTASGQPFFPALPPTAEHSE